MGAKHEAKAGAGIIKLTATRFAGNSAFDIGKLFALKTEEGQGGKD